MKNKDRIGGIIFAIFGALVTSMASGIRMPANLSEPGPRLFPCIAGVGMLICGLGMAVTAKSSGDEAPFLEKAGWKRLGIVALTLVLYYFGLEYIGFLIMTPIFAFAVIMILSSGKKINRILAWIVAVLTTVILYLLFQKVFVILLPAGKLISFTL